MSKKFCFLREYKLKKEIVWEYSFELLFNKRKIIKFTITDHYQENHKEVITNELICKLVARLNKKRIEPEPKENPNDRDVFVRNFLLTNGKKYRLIFWFKDHTTNHLWIRNCYPID